MAPLGAAAAIAAGASIALAGPAPGRLVAFAFLLGAGMLVEAFPVPMDAGRLLALRERWRLASPLAWVRPRPSFRFALG